MQQIKEMGANFILLGHYQQSGIILRLCDELGLLVWEEIPWCRGGLGGESYKNQARRMLTNMIEQHRNHPSVILWGLGNENDWPGDFQTFAKRQHTRLYGRAARPCPSPRPDALHSHSPLRVLQRHCGRLLPHHLGGLVWPPLPQLPRDGDGRNKRHHPFSSMPNGEATAMRAPYGSEQGDGQKRNR